MTKRTIKREDALDIQHKNIDEVIIVNDIMSMTAICADEALAKVRGR